MSRLSEEQRAAILADGATFDGEYVDSESLSEAIGTEHAMRALRIVAHLDGLDDDQIQRLLDWMEEDQEYSEEHRPTIKEFQRIHDRQMRAVATLARALEEVGR